MTTMYKVQTKHLNEHSTLYGGQLMEWIDNYCLAKTEIYRKKAGEKFVTRSFSCEFIAPVFLGDLIQLRISNEEKRKTSVKFDYTVISKDNVVAKGTTTFVKIYKNRKSEI